MKAKVSKKKCWSIALALLALVLFTDQWTKDLIDTKFPIREFVQEYNGRQYLVREYLPVDGSDRPVEPVQIIDGPISFSIVHVVNKGAAWGMFAGKQKWLGGFSLIALICMGIFFFNITEYYMERVIGLGLLMGGTLGNFIDRMDFIGRDSGIHGVVDFLSFRFWSYEYPSFNVADMGICIGVGLLVISMLLRPDKDGKPSWFAVKFGRRQEAAEQK